MPVGPGHRNEKRVPRPTHRIAPRVSTLSHHSLWWEAFITNIAGSDFRYAQGGIVRWRRLRQPARARSAVCPRGRDGRAVHRRDGPESLWCRTPIGSFKLRGDLVYVERLRCERPHAKGIVSATRGNHGQSLAFAAQRAGLSVAIVLPHGNSTEKNAAMCGFGAELIESCQDFDEAKEHAAEIAAERELIRAVRRTRVGVSDSQCAPSQGIKNDGIFDGIAVFHIILIH